jgi:hypothetical protein
MTTESPTPKGSGLHHMTKPLQTLDEAVIYRFALIMLQPTAGFYIPTKILHWLGDGDESIS